MYNDDSDGDGSRWEYSRQGILESSTDVIWPSMPCKLRRRSDTDPRRFTVSHPHPALQIDIGTEKMKQISHLAWDDTASDPESEGADHRGERTKMRGAIQYWSCD